MHRKCKYRRGFAMPIIDMPLEQLLTYQGKPQTQGF